MYTGPYYFHQPGRNHHKWTLDLLRDNVGDGIVIPYSTMTANGENTKTFKETIIACRKTDTKILIDTENYDPSHYQSETTHSGGSSILSSSDFRQSYVSSSLSIQHEHFANGYIIPNFETNAISRSWQENTTSICRTAQEWIGMSGNTDYPTYLTIVIPSKDIVDEDNCLKLLNYLARLKYDVDGFYFNLTDMPSLLTDADLFKGILTVVFRLKWQEFDVLFGMAGFWIEALFPMGLDSFGNGATKSRQAFVSKRKEDDGKHGYGRRGQQQPYNVFSPATMSYLRYPDDAQQIFSTLPSDELGEVFGKQTGYAPPIDQNPDRIFAAKKYGQNVRFKHFSTAMAKLATSYRLPRLNDRITLVQQRLRNAYDSDQRVGAIVGDPTRGFDKAMWLEVFNRFVDENQDDLEDLYN